MEKTVRTVCQACHCECGVLVRIEGGRVVKIEGDPNHPMNRGFICVKGRAEKDRLYHPDRLKHPLKRLGKRGEGSWKRVGWNEALDGIAEKLTVVKESYGAPSIAAIHGTGPRASLCSALLPYALGSPNRISIDLHICFAPSLIAEGVTFGHSVLMEQGPDYENAECIVVWGGNPPVSHPARGQDILRAKRKRGARLLVVDPQKTPLAAKADLWLPLRPGTDLALALGMIRVMIDEGLFDREFVDKWCHGFEELKNRVNGYTLEKVSEITWLEPEAIRKAAQLYATIKPAALHHRVAVEHNVNSTQTDRALAILVALSGNLDVKGGNVFSVPVDGYIPTIALAGAGPWLRPSAEVEQTRIGIDQYPLIAGLDAPLPFVHSGLALETMLSSEPYPLKAVYCAGANPVVNMQNVKAVWKALCGLNLLVVTDFFMTPTAELADYVLPATTWLERDECCDLSYMNFLSSRRKAVEPFYECRDDLQIVIDLVKRIPWADRDIVPWDNVYECYDWMVSGMNMDFQELQERGYVIAQPTYEKHKEKGFDTPTGKVELYSTVFEKHGYDPIPDYQEPPESPFSTPELFKDYPLILISGGRHIAYFHSEGRQIPSLRKMEPGPLMEIHPDTAKPLNIEESDWVWIEGPRNKGEQTSFRARLSEGIAPGVVHVPHGWWFPEKPGPEHGCFDSNINVVITADPPRDPICGSVPTRGTLCRISKRTE